MQHKIPIHLDQEDKFLVGLTVRQLLILVVGGTLAYLAMPTSSDFLSQLINWIATVLIAIVTVLVAFVRIQHRDLDQWFLILLMYQLHPKIFIWSSLQESGDETDRKVASDQEYAKAGIEEDEWN